MGNQASCISGGGGGHGTNMQFRYPAGSSSNSSASPISPFITIIDSASMRTCHVAHPITVAELMLQFPDRFVAEFSDEFGGGFCHHRHASRSIAALPADHATCPFHTYFLMPMHRLHTRLSAHEIHHLYHLLHASATSSPDMTRQPPVGRSHRSGSKIAPAPASKAVRSGSIHKSLSFPVLRVIEDEEEDDRADQELKTMMLMMSMPAQQPRVVLQPRRQQLTCSSMRMRPTWAPKLMTIVESAPLAV